jgi:hypothetical protein
MASSNKALLASENHGRPAIAATSKPGDFSGNGVMAARETAPNNARPAGPPASTQTPEADRMGAKTSETGPAGARTTTPTPSGTKTPETNLNSARTTETTPAEAKTPEAHPATAKPTNKTLEMNPAGANMPEKKGPAREHSMTNGGTPPKPSNIESKPPGSTPSGAKPSAPQPHVATAPPPHPTQPPHPAAKPGPPAKDKKPPG